MMGRVAGDFKDDVAAVDVGGHDQGRIAASRALPSGSSYYFLSCCSGWA
jgi:hypothetical protein